MRALREKKGFSLAEIILVVTVSSLAAAIAIGALVGLVGRARETALLAEARTVYAAALVVTGEIPAGDSDYMAGLGGLCDDSPNPAAARISQRMNDLLGAGALSDLDVPGSLPMPRMSAGMPSGTAEFTVEDGKVTKLVYTGMSGSVKYAVTIVPGGETTTERIRE